MSKDIKHRNTKEYSDLLVRTRLTSSLAFEEQHNHKINDTIHTMKFFLVLVTAVNVFLSLTGANGFVLSLRQSLADGKKWHLHESKKKGGYEFGDISRFLAKKATDKINEIR